MAQKFIKPSEVVTDSIGREGGVGRWFSALHHGRSGAIALFAIAPGEGQDVSQAWPGPTTAYYQWRPD